MKHVTISFLIILAILSSLSAQQNDCGLMTIYHTDIKKDGNSVTYESDVYIETSTSENGFIKSIYVQPVSHIVEFKPYNISINGIKPILVDIDRISFVFDLTGMNIMVGKWEAKYKTIDSPRYKMYSSFIHYSELQK